MMTNPKNRYWLMKSEPDVFSIDQLEKDKTTWWEGVRNYQARNFMMNEMSLGDQILFYHSNTQPPGIVGRAQVTKKAEPDSVQFDKKSPYFEPRAQTEKPVWYCVQVGFLEKFKFPLTLDSIRQEPNLENMLVIKKGQRLSIQPVTQKEFDYILNWGRGDL